MMEKKLPLVSIGMPVYNGERYIKSALDSLINQDYGNFELIISDNASIDQTSAICMEYARRDSRIYYHRNKTNLGAISNFLIALQMARGDYFMWAACDDLWMPSFISASVFELRRNDHASVVMSAVKRVYDDGQTIMDIVRFYGHNDPSHMSYYDLAMALAAGRPYHLYIYGVYRTAFIKQAVHNFPLVAAGDRLFVCQVALAAKFLYIDEILHVRQVSRLPIAERHKNDPLGKTWQDFFSGEKTVLAMGPYLWKSDLIPSHRKLYIPLLVIRFGYSVFRSRLRRFTNGIRFHFARFVRKYLLRQLLLP